MQSRSAFDLAAEKKTFAADEKFSIAFFSQRRFLSL